MAQFKDYVKDQLEEEIEQAGEAAEERREQADGIPERFKGKSAEEIAKAYAELEKLNSRQAQDLGTMRKTVDELLTLQSRESESPAAKEPPKPVTVDDLYENTDEAIRRVAREESSGRVEELERQLQQMKRESLLNNFSKEHPGWQETVQSPEFVEWVKESPYRLRLVKDADSYDLEAADTLLSLYDESKNRVAKAESKQKQRAAIKNATLESSSPSSPDLVETFSRIDLMEKRIAAKNGDMKAERWLKSRADAIAAAYAEGRLVD